MVCWVCAHVPGRAKGGDEAHTALPGEAGAGFISPALLMLLFWLLL
jgi:hypothetical protein